MEKTAKEVADALEVQGMKCNCDLDNWAPTVKTGHSEVCRIHRAAIEPANRTK
jgi:hypothetical protein